MELQLTMERTGKGCCSNTTVHGVVFNITVITTEERARQAKTTNDILIFFGCGFWLSYYGGILVTEQQPRFNGVKLVVIHDNTGCWIMRKSLKMQHFHFFPVVLNVLMTYIWWEYKTGWRFVHHSIFWFWKICWLAVKVGWVLLSHLSFLFTHLNLIG